VTTQQIIKRGQRLVELLKQAPYKPMQFELQLFLLFAGRNGYLDNLSLPQVDEFKEISLDWFGSVDDRQALENLFDLQDEIVRDVTLDYIVREIVQDIIKN